MTQPEVRTDADAASGIGCMVRFVWLASHVALLVLAGFIFRDHAQPLSLQSGLYWGTVLACLGLYYWEIQAYGATTMDGKPATVESWKRYAVRLVALAAVLWAGATFAG